ncbi:hypothetical protein DFH27DRAFT_288114 [Peziza echinospora]|nr:hypothetical protein DFH27DRAFT_288114 [Peziza echinospora]
MPPKQLPLITSSARSLTTIQPHNGLASYPLEKYSYAVTNSSISAFNSSQFHWNHHTQRDNLYFVIDTGGPSTYLKVIWNAQVLEYVDLTALLPVTLPVTDPLCPPQAALIALGRSPMLAIRYPESQTMRRFQLKFVLHDDFAAAKSLLESQNLLIQSAVTGAASQPTAPPPTQLQGLNRYQPSLPQGGPFNGNIPAPQNPLFHPFVAPEPLPPPRQLPDFLRGSSDVVPVPAPKEPPPVPASTSSEELAPALPIQPKPAAKKRSAPRAKKPTAPKPSLTAATKETPIYLVPSSPPRSDHAPTSEKGNSHLQPSSVGESPPLSNWPTGSKEQPSKSKSKKTSAPQKALPLVSKLARIDEVSEMPSSPTSVLTRLIEQKPKRQRLEVATKQKASTDTEKEDEVSTSSGSGDVSSPDQIDTSDHLTPGENQASTASTESVETQRFHALENLIVDKLHDEEFCELLVQVSKVWQRMGFERVFKGDQGKDDGSPGGGLFDIGL